MELIRFNILKYSVARHAFFWLTWILSFTFIKSFGASMEVYLAWFVYYIVTLPVFMGHTYLIVYWMGKKFIKGYRIVFFVILFLISIYLFSCIELIISHGFLARWFPAIFENTEPYLTTGNILISGIGNLYIVLVFIAVRLIRNWHISSEEKKNLNQLHLEDRVAEANSRIQPGLLMYASGKIEDQAEAGSENVSASIAILSDILNATMLTKDREVHRIDEEIKLLQQLTSLHALFNNAEAPKIQVNGDDLNNINVPVLVIFSLLEIILRYMKELKKITLDIASGEELFSASLCWETEEARSLCPNLLYISEQMDQFYPERFTLKQQIEEPQFTISICECR